MKRIFFAIAFTLSAGYLFAQVSEFVSEPVKVEFKADNLTKITITSPAGLGEKSRGFEKIKTEKLQIEGIVEDGDGIKQLLVNNFPIKVASDGSFVTIIDVNVGDNQLNFDVLDKKGNKFNRSYVVQGELPKVAVAGSALDRPGKYYALLIGINDYDDPDMVDLDKPIKDAEQLAKVLTTYYSFDEENVTILRNATRAEIIDNMGALRDKITRNDNVLLFYAGHGYYEEGAEIGYWIPSNGRKNSRSDWFRNSTLTDEISAIKSKHTLLIADACFSGSIFASRAAFMDASIAINKLYDLPSRKAMTSGALTEVPDRSSFLSYLTKRLESNSEKYLTSEQLFASFKIAVINNSDVVPQYGTMQKVGDEGGDFIFIRKE